MHLDPITLKFIIIAYILYFIVDIIYIRIFNTKRKKDTVFKDEFMKLLIVSWVIGVFAITLFPIVGFENGDNPTINIIPFYSYIFCFEYGAYLLPLRNVIVNILMFVPLGFILPYRNKKRITKKLVIKYLCIGAAFSIMIELTQLLFFYLNLNSRSVDIDDVILNTLGVVCGILFYKVFGRSNK